MTHGLGECTDLQEIAPTSPALYLLLFPWDALTPLTKRGYDGCVFVLMFKVFTNWCNTHLNTVGLAIESSSLTNGSLSDGVFLWELLQVVSGKNLPPINKRAYVKIQQLNNLLVCLNFLEEQDVKLFGVGPEGK